MSTAYDYIRDFRAANPNYSSLDDATILQTAAEEAEANGQLAQHPVLQQALQSSREEDRGVGGELVEGLKRGAYGVKAKLYDTAALAGKLVGSDDLHDWGREGSDAAEAESASHGAAVGSYSDIHTVKDFAYYLAGELGSQVPMVAGTAAAATAAAALAPEEIVGGGVVAGGGLLARIASGLGLTAARTAAGEVAGASLAEGATGLAAKKVAGFLAAQTAGFTQMQSYSQLEKQGGDNVVPLAVANGLIAGALQTIIPLRFLHNAEGAVGEGVVNTATKEASTVLEHASSIIKSAPSWIVNPALHAAKEGSIGMLAGIAQEAVGVTTSAMAGGNTDLSTESVARRLIQGGISGFIGGGGMGLVQGIMEKSAAPAQANPAPSPEAQLQAPAAAPVQQAPLDVAAPQIKALARLAIDQPVGQTGYLEGMLPKPHEIAADGAEEASQFRPGEVAAPKIQTPIETPGQTELPLAQVPTIRPPLANAADRFAESDRARAAQAQVRNMKGAVGGTGYLSPEMVPDAAGRSFDRSIDRTLPAANDQSTAQEAAPAQNVKGQMTLDQYQKAQARAVSAKVETAPTLKPEVAPVSEPKPTLEGVTPAETPATPSIVSTHFDNGNSVTKFAYPDNPMPELLTQAKKGTALIAIFRDENGNEFSAPVVYNHNEVKVVPEGAKAAVGGEKLTTKEAAKAIVAERTQTGEKISESAVNQILNATGPSADVTKPQLKQRNTEVLQRAWELGWRGNSSDKISKYTEGSGMKLVGYAETAQPVTEGGLRPLPKEISAQGATEGHPIATRAAEKSGTPLVTKEIARQFAADTGLEAESIAGLLKQKDPAVKARALDELSKFILAGTEDKARSAFESQYMTDPKMREQIRASTESSLKAVAEELSHKTNVQKIGRNVSEAAGVAVDNNARARDFEFERQQPDGTPVSNEPIRQQFDRAVQTAQAHGIDVSIAQATEKLKAGGRYNPSNRSMMLVMKNVIEPSRQDLISTYHEIFHDMVKQAPPEAQAALQKLADSNAFSGILDGNPQGDPRVAGKGSTLSPAQLTDERLVEAMALNGVDKQVAQGLVPAIWRAVKDHFIAAALYIQEKLVGSDYLGGKLAEAYADNMVSKIRAGDKMTLDSFMDNWTKPFTAAQATPLIVKDGQFVARRTISADGRSSYPTASDLSFASIEHNVRAPLAALRDEIAISGLAEKASTEDMLAEQGFTVKRESADLLKKKISDQLSVAIPKHKQMIAASNQIAIWQKQLHQIHLAELPVYSEGDLAALRAQGQPQPAAPDFETFLRTFGLENAEKKSQLVVDLVTAQFKAEGIEDALINAKLDPKILVEQLETQGDKDNALALAKVHLQGDLSRIAEVKTKADKTYNDLFKGADLRKAQIVNIDKNLLDQRESAKIVRQYVRGYMQDLPAQLERYADKAEAGGFMRGVLSEIDPKAGEINKYTDKLIQSINLDDVPISGILRNMFEMQRNKEFNLNSDSPSKIRSALVRYAEENPESSVSDLINLHGQPLKANVLLAGLITFAKQQGHIAKLVEHQTFRTSEDIAALNSLRDQLREKNDDKLTKALAAFEMTQTNDKQLVEGLQKGLGVTRQPSATLSHLWLSERKSAMADQVAMFQAERVKNSADSLSGQMVKMMGAIDQRLKLGFETNLIPGSNFPTPANADVPSAEIFNAPHATKLLGSQNGTLDQAQVEKALGSLKVWLDARRDKPEMQDQNYQAAARLYDRTRNMVVFQSEKFATLSGITSGHLENIARVAQATNSRSGELVSTGVHKYAELMNTSKVFAPTEGTKVTVGLERFLKAIKIDNGAIVTERYLPWALDAFNTRREDILTHDDAWRYLREKVDAATDPVLSPLKNAATWGSFKNWINAELATNAKMGKLNFEKHDALVRDDRFRVVNKQTGEEEFAVRKPIEHGVQTVPRYISGRAIATIKEIANDLTAFKDSSLTELPGDYNQDWKTRLSLALEKLSSSDKAWETLISPLFMDNPNSTMPAPAREDNIRIPVPEAKARDAFKGRDILAIAGNIYDSMGGSTTESREQYQLKLASWLTRTLNGLSDVVSPKSAFSDITTERTGLPRVMLESRDTTTYPPSWLEYKSMNQESIHRVLHSIAANVAFGSNYKELSANISDMASEVQAKADAWTGKYGDPKERAKLKKSDPALYEELKASDYKAKELGPGGRRYFGIINKLFSPDGVRSSDPSLLRDMFNLSVSAMLTGPRSAVRNLISPVNRFMEAKSIAPEVWYDIGHAYKGLAQHAMAGLWNIMGIKTWIPSERYWQLETDILGGSPTQTHNIAELWAGHRGSDFENDKSESTGKVAVRKFLTRMRAVVLHSKLSFSDNPAGPVLQPNLFQWTQVNQNSADFMTTTRRFEVTASKIADFYRDNPDRVGTPVTAKEVGVSGNFYKNMMSRWAEYSLDPHRLAETMIKSPTGTETLDGDTVQKLWNYNSSAITGEANFLNRPAFTQTSTFGKFTSTLLGFPMFQTAKLFEMARTTEGRTTLRSAAQAATVFALGILPVSLAFSKVLDEYDEELVGKHTSNRPFNDDAKNNVFAITDRLIAAGTLGLAGDIIPTALNAAGSPSGRNMISLDNRIVWVNQVIQLAKSVKDLIAMGPENVNYANFYRPLMNTAGMLGPLQNLDVANHLAQRLGIETRELPGVGGMLGAESDVINRQSVYAWLRGAAYANKLEVRGAGQGDYTPNAATPWVTDMALAAYSNDREGFQTAYRGAIRAAQGMGISTDAFSYVKRAYASRNPLLSVLKNRPSTGEYAMMLRTLPDDGRLAVQHAVTLFNMYGSGLGLQPFNGISADDPRRERRIQNTRIADQRGWF